MGFAHSIEVWSDGALIGGLYGVALRAAFFGESMFSRKSDASKIALVHLMARLRHGNFLLLDAQFTNDHLQQFGVTEIDRSEFQGRLAEALASDGDLHFDTPSAALVMPYLDQLAKLAPNRQNRQEASDHKPDVQAPISQGWRKKSSQRKPALGQAHHIHDHEP
jgi:leucyl/phenylalanyl-tRNA--protein transferase